MNDTDAERRLQETSATAGDGVDKATAHTNGFCPVKAEFIRPAPVRVVLDELGRTRGLNSGSERALCASVPGTQAPSLLGEKNFLNLHTLQRIKSITRKVPIKRSLTEKEIQRDAEEGEAATSASVCLPNAVPGGHSVCTDVYHEEACGNSVSHTKKPLCEEALYDEERTLRIKKRSIFTDKLILAPLTTVGNLPFRRICKRLGADVTMSEMAVVYNLNHLQKSEWALLRRHSDEDIFGIQLAVNHPNEARTIAQALRASEFEYDFIDVNCGCPVDAIVRYGCGCALGERKGRLKAVMRELTSSQNKPVSIKCRIGPDDRLPVLHKQIGEFEMWGASSVTVHGRSRKQRYTKAANWDYINECSSMTNLPVVGNGDILSWDDAELHRNKHSYVSSLMIGRGALIKPWIFDEIKTSRTRDVSSAERFQLLKNFCDFGMDHWGSDKRGIMTTRRFLCEWLSFFHRYVPVALMERLPQKINERPPHYIGRDDLETILASSSVIDWIKISEMILGPAEAEFRFTPKHRSNSYATSADATHASMKTEDNVQG